MGSTSVIEDTTPHGAESPSEFLAAETASRERLRQVLLPQWSGARVAGAGVLVAASLTPSLLPRGWLTQGVVSGVALAAGYGLAVVSGRLLDPVLRRVPAQVRARLGAVVALLAVTLAVAALVAHQLWQVEVRRLMQADTGIAVYPLAISLTALLVGYLTLQVGRLVGWAHAWQVHRLSRLLPRPWARALQATVNAVLVVLFLDVVVAGQVFSAVEDASVTGNARLESQVAPPSSPYRAGSSASLLAWDDLGREGRRFVTAGPSTVLIEEFTGRPGIEPIRVYAGLSSADTAEERARLAVAELDRTGAFTRDVVVVVAPTGTGWVDPYAVAPLEYMYGGNSAAVAIQYSYRPSWIQLLGNQDVAKEAAAALFGAVRDRIDQEPAASRPLLLLYGQSLGAFGSEAIFENLDDLIRRTDGVLWVGPPGSNQLWHEFTTQREPDSPIWQPVYRNGRHVRFGADAASLSQPPGAWGPPRVVYLQHSSDPVTWWGPELLFTRPDWLDQPRGPDVSEEVPYLPVLTFLQLGIDLAQSTDAPVEHGHNFGPAQAHAWALIAPPPDWSPQRAEELGAAIPVED